MRHSSLDLKQSHDRSEHRRSSQPSLVPQVRDESLSKCAKVTGTNCKTQLLTPMSSSIYASWLPVISQKSSCAKAQGAKTVKLLTPLEMQSSHRKSVDLNSKHNFKILFSHDPKMTKVMFGLS